MIFTASRGRAFREHFTFRNASGKIITVPPGDYRVLLERGGTVKEYELRAVRGAESITWNLTAEETKALEFSTMYFVLTLNGNEVARGVLRVN